MFVKTDARKQTALCTATWAGQSAFGLGVGSDYSIVQDSVGKGDKWINSLLFFMIVI